MAETPPMSFFIHFFIHMNLFKTMIPLPSLAKVLAGTLLFIGSVLSSSASVVSFGTPQLFDDAWQFTLSDPANAADPGFDDSGWTTVDLPHDWSVKGKLDENLASCTGFLPGGIGWYRKSVVIPSDAKLGNEVFFYFEGVYNRSSVYLNGHLLGSRPNGYISFLYDATPYVRFNQVNTIAVRVDHSRSADSRWYTGSGIYRNVWMVRSQPVHIAQWGVFAHADKISADEATMLVETDMANESATPVTLTLVCELLSANGAELSRESSSVELAANAERKETLSLAVKKPEFWSLDRPYLYKVRTSLWQNGKCVDQSLVSTGIRVMKFDPDKGFSLNGVNMKMKGVCLHHDAGVLGSAVPREVWKERLLALKEIGCNAIRTSHNPQAPEFYDLCDELGLLVLDEAFDEWEFPKRKWLTGWNVGTPGFEGSNDFFEEWSSRDVADMVRRDRNHPSIFAWSIGNEVDYPNDPYSHPVLDNVAIDQPMFGGYDPKRPDANRLGGIAKRLVAVVKDHDTSRPVTAALAGVVMSNSTEYPGALDITGYNYTEGRYAIDHKQYPHRVIFGSENKNDYKAWLATRDNDFVFGQFLWTGIDYLGESTPWPARGFYSGLLDFGGFMKPRGAFRQSLWSDSPVIHLGTEPAPESDRQTIDAWPIWNYATGEKVRVYSYTNAATAALFLDGKQVGGKKSRSEETGIIFWDVPFAAGKLEAVGYDAAGKEICRNHISTSGAPAKMEISCKGPVISKDRGLAMVVVQLVDDKGVPAMLAENSIRCTVDGPAKLLGLEAGNNRDMGDYTDNVQNAYRGRLLAYVQATGSAGEVVVRFEADGVPAASMSLKVQ
jgi:hypothetical protein